MRDYFYELADALCASIKGTERLALAFSGEASDFVRLNKGRIRQAGYVKQRAVALHLVEGRRHGHVFCDLEGDGERDLARLGHLLTILRSQREHLPEDPFLTFPDEPWSSERTAPALIPDSRSVINDIVRAASGLDLVGIWASGPVYRGFADSRGQRNWHACTTFNLDWSCYLEGNRAVKANYAGLRWDASVLREKIERCRRQLAPLAKAPMTLRRGNYRVYLEPAALREIMDMMAWGGFGLKDQRTAQTPLLKLIRKQVTLDRLISITEDNRRGLAPPFTADGFRKPRRIPLVHEGRYQQSLVGSRSSAEFGEQVNSDAEYPLSLDMAGGSLDRNEVLDALDKGILISNLWYCNFSDRNECRITGMTRFACFWVEKGRIQAPVGVMRFDDSVFRLLGDNLRELTRERDLILDSNTYGQRSLASYRLPGGLIEGFRLTL